MSFGTGTLELQRAVDFWFAPACTDCLPAQAESSRGTKRKAERSEDADSDNLPLGLVRPHKSRRRRTGAGLPTLCGFAPLESLRFGVPPPAAALVAPVAQHRRRLCAVQLRRRALPLSATAASAGLGDALELEDMSEAELQALRGPPAGAALVLPAPAAAGALASTGATAKLLDTPAGALAGGNAGAEATIGSRTKAARTAPRTQSGPGGERLGGDDTAVVQLNFGAPAEGQGAAAAGAERTQGAAPVGSETWPGAARAAEPGLAGLTSGHAKEQAGGGAPAQGTGQAPPAAAPAFMFGAAAAAPAAPATQAPAQQPAHTHFALGTSAQAHAAAGMAGAASGQTLGGGLPAGPTAGAPTQSLFGGGAPAPGPPADAAPQAAGFAMPAAGAPAPAVGAFAFGGAPAPAHAPQAIAFGGQAGGFGASASAAFGQPPLQVCLSTSDFGCIVLCCTCTDKAGRAPLASPVLLGGTLLDVPGTFAWDQQFLMCADARHAWQAAPGLAHGGSMGAAGFTMGGGDQQKAARRVVKAKRPGRR